MPIEHLLPEVLPALPRSALPVDTFFAAYRDVFRHPLSMPSVTVGAEPPIPTKDAEFPLGLAVWESSTAATAQLSYGAWAYCRADAEALGTAYVDLLARGTDDPDRPLGQLVATAGRTW